MFFSGLPLIHMVRNKFRFFTLLFFGLSFLVIAACSTGFHFIYDGTQASDFSFEPLDTNFTTTQLLLPKGFQMQVLFEEKDDVIANNNLIGKAKPKFDFLAYLTIDGNRLHAYLWVNHECGVPSPVLGDGGGGSILEIKWNSNQRKWDVLNKHNADFSSVGGTLLNCLGGVSPWGTILTSEETEPWTDSLLYYFLGIDDLSPLNGYPRHLNYGWMVEVDVKEKKAIRKLWSMGRFMHEGAHCMPDQKTVYLMDDEAPSVFFKFVAKKPGSYEEGQLFAFKQGENGRKGTWLPMPTDRDSLNFIRWVALEKGATYFVRMEDMVELPDGKFIITETGRDTANLKLALLLGGQPAHHLKKFTVNDTLIYDYYGRLLLYDPKTESISVLLEGGQGKKIATHHFSNPDNIAYHSGKNILAICEDINGTNYGRVPAYALGKTTNEIWMLDLNILNPQIDDLKRFAITPLGSEPTGIIFNPDENQLLFNIQHPDTLNPAPWHLSKTIATWKD